MSRVVLAKAREYNELDEYINLPIKYITTYFDVENFIITKYVPKNNNVGLILEFENGDVLQIENACCGYSGEGGRTTLEILSKFGFKNEMIDYLIKNRLGVKFEVEYIEDKPQLFPIIEDSIIYCCQTKEYMFGNEIKNMIRSNAIEVDFENACINYYNPIKNSWVGFQKLAKLIGCEKIEYEVDHKGNKNEAKLCLVLHGNPYTIDCYVTDQYMEETIDAVLTLFNYNKIFYINNKWQQFKNMLISKNETYGYIDL